MPKITIVERLPHLFNEVLLAARDRQRNRRRPQRARGRFMWAQRALAQQGDDLFAHAADDHLFQF